MLFEYILPQTVIQIRNGLRQYSMSQFVWYLEINFYDLATCSALDLLKTRKTR